MKMAWRSSIHSVDSARGKAVPTLSVPWQSAEYCVLDFEATGLNLSRDRVCSVGVVPVIDGRIRTDLSWYTLISPAAAMPDASARIHSLLDLDLAEAPGLEDVVDQLVDLLAGRVLVAHAAWVELGFLTRILSRRRLKPPRHVVDTAALARASGLAIRRGPEPSLEVMCSKLGLPVHTPHHALGDAVNTAQVFVALAHRVLATREQRTLRALLKISDRARRR
jgi:DNA polymerase-3 subunit epsilon